MADHSPPAGRSPLFQPLPIHVYLVGSAFAITLGVLEQKVFKVERPLALRLFDAIASRHPEPSHRGQAVKPRVSSRVGWTTLFDTPDVDDVGNVLAVAAGHVDQAAANSGSVGTLLPYLNAELDVPISHLEPQIFLAGPREFSYDSGAFFDASDLPTPTATSTAAHADSEHAWSVWRTMLIMLALVVLGILVVTARNRGQRSDIGLVVRRCVVLGKRVARHLRLFIHRTIATRMTRGSEFISTNICPSTPPSPTSSSCPSSPTTSPGRKARKALRPKPKLRTGLKVRKSIFEIDWDVAQFCVPGCPCGRGLDSCTSSDNDTGCTIV